MRRILGIDPGTYESAYVVLRGRVIDEHAKIDNDSLLFRLDSVEADVMAIEMIAPYGQIVGKDTFETCVWIGRFLERWSGPSVRLFRKQRGPRIDSIGGQLCGTTKINDAMIRRAVIDRFPPSGGGKSPQIGTKKAPGPLYGLGKDEWQALAVALTYQECRE